MHNPTSQREATAHTRIDVRARNPSWLRTVPVAWQFCLLAHYPGTSNASTWLCLWFRPPFTVLTQELPGMLCSPRSSRHLPRAVCFGTCIQPLPLNLQSASRRTVRSRPPHGNGSRIVVVPPKAMEPWAARENYEVRDACLCWGPSPCGSLADVALARAINESIHQYGYLSRPRPSRTGFAASLPHGKSDLAYGKGLENRVLLGTASSSPSCAPHRFCRLRGLGQGRQQLVAAWQAGEEALQSLIIPIPAELSSAKLENIKPSR